MAQTYLVIPPTISHLGPSRARFSWRDSSNGSFDAVRA